MRFKAYVSRNLESSTISSCDHHLAQQIGMTTFIGCYYQPNMNFDDTIADIANILNKVSNCDKILLGGGFNIRPQSIELREVKKFCGTYNISLMSIP